MGAMYVKVRTYVKWLTAKLSGTMPAMRNYDPLQMLRERIAKTSQRAVAAELEVSPAYLCDVLAGRRDPGKSILKGLGLRRVVRYERIPDGSGG